MQFLTEANEGNEGGPGGSVEWAAYTPAHQIVSAHRWRILPFGQHKKPSFPSFASVQLNFYGLTKQQSTRSLFYCFPARTGSGTLPISIRPAWRWNHSSGRLRRDSITF